MGDILLVCINRQQPQALKDMLMATCSFGAMRILVLDRSPDLSGDGWPHIVRNSDGDGWLAGRMRDLGLSYARQNFPEYKGVLFIDGDRIPLVDLYSSCQGDVVLFSVEEDPRGQAPVGLNDCTEWCCDFKESPFMSPALYLSKTCIDKVSENGRLFAPCFDGIWGEEDRDLGDRIVSAGFRVMASDSKVSGTLVDRFSQGVDSRNFHLRKKRYDERNISNRIKLDSCI